MKKKKNLNFNEWMSVQIVEHPRRVILLAIMVLNIIFVLLAAGVITALTSARPDSGFFESLFYTVTMILDAGCVQYVIESVDSVGAFTTIVCIIIIVSGMILFTGCIIGYITNVISNFIDNSNAGKRKLNVSNHTVILNWNSRASEIINDLLYSEDDEIIVVLADQEKENIEEEIRNRLSDTINQENKKINVQCKGMGYFEKRKYKRKHKFENNLTIIVKEGDTFSETQLLNISVDKAKAVIILNRDETNKCYTSTLERTKVMQQGNALTVKTLVLVAEITSNEDSLDDQKIIVEVDDEWTYELVQKIIKHKEKIEKCNIIPISVNRVLGQLLSQFSIMPDLNKVYSLLFSNEGAEFYSTASRNIKEDEQDVLSYLDYHRYAVPLTYMNTKIGEQFFYMADKSADYSRRYPTDHKQLHLECNKDYWLPKRNVLLLGHNSKISSIMDGFNSFISEWDKEGGILNVAVIDSEDNLKYANNYSNYSYVNPDYIVGADLYNQDKIYESINRFIDDEPGDTCILILSDDTVNTEDLDASALTFLIYVQDILAQRKEKYGEKDIERIDTVIEILNPKNYDVVRSYSVDNVVISNRYISKMITQIGEKETLFEFYSDILSYDEEDASSYESKELYIKRVGDFFTEIPEACNAADLIYNVYKDAKRIDSTNETVVLGYIPEGKEMIIFANNQYEIEIELKENDSLILFSNH